MNKLVLAIGIIISAPAIAYTDPLFKTQNKPDPQTAELLSTCAASNYILANLSANNYNLRSRYQQNGTAMLSVASRTDVNALSKTDKLVRTGTQAITSGNTSMRQEVLKTQSECERHFNR